MINTNKFNNIKDIIRYKIEKVLPPDLYPHILKVVYKKLLKKSLNLKNPKRFSEKIQWLKLYENNLLKNKLSDKLESRKFAKKLIPEIKISKIYAVGKKFEDINFEVLPESFVLKTNNACKTNILVKSKSKLPKSKYIEISKYFKKALKIKYEYWNNFELQYKDIHPLIYAEEYLVNSNSSYNIAEHEVYCFNGKPEIIRTILTCTNECGEYYKAYNYDTNFEPSEYKIFFGTEYNNNDFKSANKDYILNYSKILSKDFNFVRVDYLEVNNQLYFSEMTFTPYSGFIEFIPEKYDLIFGEKLDLK